MKMGEGEIEVTAQGLGGGLRVYPQAEGGSVLEQWSRDQICDSSVFFLLWLSPEQLAPLCWPWCSGCKTGKVTAPDPYPLLSSSALSLSVSGQLSLSSWFPL